MRSSEASKRTIASRNKTLAELRNSISGGDSLLQLRTELRALSKEEREEVLEGANLPVVIPTDHALAMKADLALPWAKMRVISR